MKRVLATAALVSAAIPWTSANAVAVNSRDANGMRAAATSASLSGGDVPMIRYG